MTTQSETCIGYPKRKIPDPTRLKAEIGSGLKSNFFRVRVRVRVRVGFRVSTFLLWSGSGLRTNFFSEKY